MLPPAEAPHAADTSRVVSALTVSVHAQYAKAQGRQHVRHAVTHNTAAVLAKIRRLQASANLLLFGENFRLVNSDADSKFDVATCAALHALLTFTADVQSCMQCFQHTP